MGKRKQLYKIIGTNISTGLQFILPNLRIRFFQVRGQLIQSVCDSEPFLYNDPESDYGFVIPAEVIKQCTWTIHRQDEWEGGHPTVGVR